MYHKVLVFIGVICFSNMTWGDTIFDAPNNIGVLANKVRTANSSAVTTRSVQDVVFDTLDLLFKEKSTIESPSDCTHFIRKNINESSLNHFYSFAYYSKYLKAGELYNDSTVDLRDNSSKAGLPKSQAKLNSYDPTQGIHMSSYCANQLEIISEKIVILPSINIIDNNHEVFKSYENQKCKLTQLNYNNDFEYYIAYCENIPRGLSTFIKPDYEEIL